MRRTTSTAHRAILATLLVGVLALAGCTTPGQDEPAPSPETPATTASASPPPEQPTEETGEPETVLNQHGVNAGHPLAAEAGMEMLNAGGTAADAAVAAAFAVSVVEPYASGVGGGGSALIAGPEGTPEFIDYREVVAADGVIPPSNTGIPGFVRGMGELHARHGKLEWAQLLEPAIRMAENGVPATEQLVIRMGGAGANAVAGQPQFTPGGVPLQVGQTLVQTELAQTFRTLQNEGPDSFYTGTLAEQVSQVNGIDPTSLEQYGVQRSTPPQARMGDYQLVGASPALPGAAMIQMLQILEARGVEQLDPNSAEYARQISEAWLIAEDTVETQLGDPAFTDVPVEQITDPERNAQLAGVDATAAAPAGGEVEVSPSTTHITVVDSNGMTVSMTNTLTEFWGSGNEIGGFFLNDQLNRFNTFDSPQNQPEPGRRSVTWSNPAMVLDNEGRPVLGIGTPGGSNILSILGNALVRWGLMGQSLDEAVAAPRFRFDEDTQTVIAEDRFIGTRAAQGLAAQGWPVRQAAPGLFGSLQTLEINYEDGTVYGPTDTRLEAGTVVSDVE